MKKETFGPMPKKLINPTFKLLEQQKLIKEEVIERLKTKNFPNGLAPYYSTIISLTSEELEEVFNVWVMKDEIELVFYYMIALKNKDLEALKESDKKYLEAQKIKQMVIEEETGLTR